MVYENEINLIKVENGANGVPGEKGNDGKTLYTWVKYSQYADGTDLTDDPTDAIYIGIAYNKEEQIESNNKYDYTWSKIKGEDGQNGQPGKSIKSIVPQYYLSTSNTTQTGGSWSTTVPTWVSGKYIWTRNYITWSDDTTSTTTAVLDNSLNELGDRVTKAEASIKTNAESIESKVSKTDYTGEQIASLINQTAESIKIIAEHIQLEGIITANGYFKINKDGSMESIAGTFSDYLLVKNKSQTVSGRFCADESSYTSPAQYEYTNGHITGISSATTSYKCFALKNANGTAFNELRLRGVLSDYVHANNIATDNLSAQTLIANKVLSASGADLDSLNNKIANAGIYTLLLPTKGSGTYTLYGGRKLSDYSLLIATLGYNISDVRNSIFIGKNDFAGSNILIRLQALHGSSTSNASDYRISSATIKYVSDNSISVELGGSRVLDTVGLYGIRFK